MLRIMSFKSTLILITGLLAVQTQAIQFISTNTYTLGVDETLVDESWIQASDANVNGLVKDDLFLFGENQILLDGEFKHNIWTAGAGIELTGKADRNVRLLGKTIQIKNHIGGNLLVIGDTIKVTPDATIDGDMKLLGNSIILGGITQGDLSVTASRGVTLSGRIKGNVKIIAPKIILQRDTRIDGNLTYTTGKELVLPKEVVAGKLKRALPATAPLFSKERLLQRLIWFFAALLVGLPFISLFPLTTAIASQIVRKSPFKCLWVGAIFILTLPVLGILCLSSGTGIPLGAFILGGWGFLFYASRIIIGLVIGTLILRRNNTSTGEVLRALIVGLFLIYITTAIPSISFSIWITIISMGSGALLLAMFQKRKILIQVPKAPA